MSLPNRPPVDVDPNLSSDDVAACIWWTWCSVYGDSTSYPTPADLMAQTITRTIPPKVEGPSPDGLRSNLMERINQTLDVWTRFRLNVHPTVLSDYDSDGKTWADFVEATWEGAIYR